MGQQTGCEVPSQIVLFSAQDFVDGSRHFLASGQQYSDVEITLAGVVVVSIGEVVVVVVAGGISQGDSHALPGFTQSCVTGQHTGCEVPSQTVLFVAHDIVDGVKHFFASGQQYSVALHAGGGRQLAPGFTQS